MTNIFNFLDIVEDKSGGNKKIPQSEYLEKGNIPVIDQGQAFIAGYTNQEEYLFNSAELPIVIFGDHTKAVKYIDFPFAMGADGVKVLKPKDELDTKYLYHFLKYTPITDAGYSRHFKFLKEKLVPVPPLEEQRRIASILDKADDIRQKRQQAIAKLDELLLSEFLKKFSNKNFKTVMVQELLETEKSMRTGPFGSQLLHSEFVDEGIAVLGIDNAVKNQFQWGKPRFITEQKYKTLSRYTVQPNDVLITIMGTCGRCAVVPEDIPKAINTKHLCCITLDKTKCEPEFLHSYFLMHPTARNYLESRAKGAIMDGLNMGIIKELPVELPPLEDQKAFVKFKKVISSQKRLMEQDAEKIEQMFKSLQQKAFNGTL
ncbi:restriction endonuclease subunit S [Acinetobacter sp.]|uniref:restriction endonuclease subunit S n=1 Tax=Acinetobacter sp. TaxID=472 RepID=UPI00289DA964|nr:restriction endonuclease subunit S [Acinetobacter sp.]